MAERQTFEAGIGKYVCEMEWQQASYENQEGNGLSEYYFYFDSNPHPKDFLKHMLDLISRARASYDQQNKTTLVVNNTFNPSVFNIASQTLHRLAAAYCPDSFKGNEDQAPFMYGEYDKEGLIEIKEGKLINLTPEQFALDETDERLKDDLLGIVLNELFIPRNEQQKSVVHLSYEGVDYGICVTKTPDKGFVGGIIGGDPFYAFEIVTGNSVEEIVGILLQPLLNKLAGLLMKLNG